jgi:hypothetical protein
MKRRRWRLNFHIKGIQLIGFIILLAQLSYGNLVKWPPYESDLWLLKLNSAGDTIWTCNISDAASLYQYISVNQCADGGYIIKGEEYRNDWSFFALKTDSVGDILWYWEKENGYLEFPKLLADSLAYRQAVTWVTPLKSDTIWNFRANQIRHMFRTSDDNWIRVNTVEDTCVRLIKEDPDRDNIWSRIYCFEENSLCEVSSVNSSVDEGYIITGVKYVVGHESEKSDLLIVKTDPSGEMIWIRTYSIAEKLNYGQYASSTSDGGYIVVAEIRLKP